MIPFFGWILVINLSCGLGEAANPKEDLADRQSHAALLRTGDLPGGWQVIQRDVFFEQLTPFPDTAACKGQYELSAAILDFRNALLGRAQIELGLRTAGRTQGFQIEHWVEIYDSEAKAAELLSTMRTYLSEKTVRCQQDELTVKGSTSKVGVLDAQSEPPPGGVVLASIWDSSTPSRSDKIRYEYYYWVSGNTGITLVITGVDEEITSDLATTAITKAIEGLARAQGTR
jgi:hypothetical protein